MFELAAFLHSHDTNASKSLVVCPIFVGPALLIAQMGLCIVVLGFVCSQLGLFPWGTLMVCSLAFPCMTLLAYVVLAHCRSIIVMQQQLSQFRIEHAKSQCCDCGHVNEYTGDKMICDRNIILRCISAWFGSTEQFEALVQDRLLKTLVHHLTNEVFSYFRIVQATSPVGWVSIDIFLGGWIRHEFDVGGLVLMSSAVVSYWLMVFPCILFFMLRLMYKFKGGGQSPTMRTQVLLSVGLVATGTLMFFCFAAAESFNSNLFLHHFGHKAYSSPVTVPLMGVVTFLLWRCLPAADISTP